MTNHHGATDSGGATDGTDGSDKTDATDEDAWTSNGRVRVVGAAVLRDGRVLASRRTEPPRLAGLWEFPGGKVEHGETDQQALARELCEELGVSAQIGRRFGPDLPIGDAAVLRVYLATFQGEPELVDHDAHRWLALAELDDVAWIPVDLPLVDLLRDVLPG